MEIKYGTEIVKKNKLIGTTKLQQDIHNTWIIQTERNYQQFFIQMKKYCSQITNPNIQI